MKIFYSKAFGQIFMISLFVTFFQNLKANDLAGTEKKTVVTAYNFSLADTAKHRAQKKDKDRDKDFGENIAGKKDKDFDKDNKTPEDGVDDDIMARDKQEADRLRDPVLKVVPVKRIMEARRIKDQLSIRRGNNMAPLNSLAGTNAPPSISGIQWTERGPNNVGGRTRALMFDLNDAVHNYKKVFAGGVGGGLWYTNDITATPVVWNKINDFFENIAISCITQNPVNPQEIYVGTGEGWYNSDSIQGLGVWKSADGGVNWTHLTSTDSFLFINSILVDKNGSVYVAGRDLGVQKSSDGGTTWSEVISSPSDGADLQLAANGDIYASTGVFSTGNIFISDFLVNGANTGNTGTWTNITPTAAGTITPATTSWFRIKLTCAPSNANIVYALFEGNDTYGLSSLQQYNKATNSWKVKTVPPGSSFSNSQAWYSIATAVDPNQANTLFTGSLDAVKSTDGGSTWTPITEWESGEISGLGDAQYVHADHHAYVFAPGSSSRLMMGTDGGVFYTANANVGGGVKPTFLAKDNGYNVTQFYSVALHPTNMNYALAGAQDNGTQQFNSAGINTTAQATGGDGAGTFIDQQNGNIQITSYVYNNHWISTDNGINFTQVFFNNNGSFINPSDYDPNQKNLYSGMYGGTFFRWNNVVNVASPSTSTVSVSGFNNGAITAVKVSPLTNNRVYFGLNNGTVVRVDNANSGFSYAGVILKPNPAVAASVSCIAIDPATEDHLLVTYFNYGVVSIYETKNATAATPVWTAVEGNLPDMPVRWAMFYPDYPSKAIIATELGVWTTDLLNGSSTTWDPSNSGLANVSVDMLTFRPFDRTLAAATHGRGLFTTTLPFEAAPTISYASPQVYSTGVPATLTPNSAGVAPPAYHSSHSTLASGFNGPFGVAADAAGNVYLADYTNNAVKKIPAGGGTPVTIGVASAPWGVALDAANNVYTTATGSGQVVKIPAGGGAPVVFASGFTAPAGLAIDAAGNLYVGDIGNNQVEKIPAGGGTPVVLGSGFNGPFGLAVDAADNVYVADGGNNAVKEIPVGGGPPVTLGSGFSSPHGVALDVAGNVYVADFNNNAIKEIPAAGGPVVTLDAAFAHPAGIAIDGAGNLYASDQTNNAVGKLIPVGGYYINPFLPHGLTFNNSTGILSGTPTGGSPSKNYKITAYNPLGKATATVNIKVNPPVAVTLTYSSPDTYAAGAAIDPLKPTSSGVSGPGYSMSAAILGNGFGLPVGVAIDAAGNIFVADKANGVIKKLPAGGGAPVTVGPAFNAPWGVAVDAAGNLYVSDTGNGQVYKIPAGGGAPVIIGSGFGFPAGLAVNSGGGVYVADAGSNVVKKIPAGGGTPVQVGSGFNAPYDVTLDDAGNIYVADYGNNAIKRIPAGGGAAVVFVSGLSQPQGVAADHSGNIFIADSGNGLIKEVVGGVGGAVTLGYQSGGPTILKTDGSGNLVVSYSGDNTVRQIKPVGGYFIKTALPAGLSFAGATGIISGTPTVAAGAKNYTVTAYNPASSHAAIVNIKITINVNLANLAISSGTLAPAFAAATTSYAASVPNATSSITVTPTVSDATATVKVNGTTVASGMASASLPLVVGPNTINAIVTGHDGTTTKTYTLTVTRAASSNASLWNLKINNGAITLTPSFISGTTSYTANVTNATTSIKITPATANADATVKVNGTPVASGTASASLPLAVGPNTITTVVTAGDGTTTKTYTVTVTRALSANADLTALKLSSGTLNPVFASATTAYTASVTNATTSITLTPTTSDASATVTVNGTAVTSGSASGSVALVVGPNTITTAVTAQDGATTKTYTLTVTRAASSNAKLWNLKINYGAIALSPAFNSGTTSYTANVANTTTSVKITAATSDANATVKVNGATVTSGTASAAINLNTGPNTISTVVTAQDGITTKTYTLTVTRAAAPVKSISVKNSVLGIQPGMDGISVHQGVSPNSDGINDYLVIDGITNYPDNKLMIINRNGTLVYEAKGYNNSTHVFDGHSSKNGSKQLPGTYFYSLDYKVKGVTRHKTGFIVLKY